MPDLFYTALVSSLILKVVESFTPYYNHASIATSSIMQAIDSNQNISSTTTTTTTTSATETLTTSTIQPSPSSSLLSSLTKDLLQELLNDARQGGLPFIALAVAITDTVPILPTQPLSIMAGALFGFQRGLMAVTVGQSFATAFAFLVGRYILGKRGDYKGYRSIPNVGNVGRYVSTSHSLHSSESSTSSESLSIEDGTSTEEEPTINTTINTNNTITNNTKTNNKTNDNNKLQKLLQELVEPLNSNDNFTIFSTIFIARQSPVLPFSLGNYFIGAATHAALFPCWIGTILGCMPLNCVWVLTGSTGVAAMGTLNVGSGSAGGSGSGDGSGDGDDLDVSQVQHGLYVFGSLVTVLFLAYVVQTLRKVYATSND